MATLGLAESFARFGATLTNPMWAVSSIAGDGALVISCWEHHMRPAGPGVLQLTDRLSRWSGNRLGNALLREHLQAALDGALPVRPVIATASDPDAVQRGHDASKIKKTFDPRPDLVGQVISFDGDLFVVDFRRSSR